MANVFGTGYVHKFLDNDLSFKDFVLTVAGSYMNSGTAVSGKKIEPDTYYSEQIKKAKSELKKLIKMGPAEIESWGKGQKEDKTRSLSEQQATNNVEIERCKKLLKEIRAWKAPRVCSHLKKDIISQLTSTIGVDKSKPYVDGMFYFTSISPKKLWETTVKELKKSIKYWTKCDLKEKRLNKIQNDFVKALVKSLK